MAIIKPHQAATVLYGQGLPDSSQLQASNNLLTSAHDVKSTAVLPILLTPNAPLGSGTFERVRQKVQWHMFSPTVAGMINPNQPDITAAIILYGLMLWQKNGYKQTKIEGKRYCFRSLNELQQDHPYFTRTQIHKAIKRAKTALKESFTTTTKKKKSWFSQTAELIKIQFDDKCLRFRVVAAQEYGVTAAVLLANMEWQFEKHHELPTDAAGNKYGSLSPVILQKLLPFSEDTIARTLKDLCGKFNALIPHPVNNRHYALAATFRHATKALEPELAEVNDETAEVNDETAEVDNCEGTSSNQIIRKDIKVIFNPPSSATRIRSVAAINIISSAGLKYLDQVAKQSVCQLKLQNAISAASPRISKKVSDEYLPYDDYRFAKFDLPCDTIINNGSIKEWVDGHVDEFKFFCMAKKISYTPADLQKVRVFWGDNQNIPDDFFGEIFSNLDPEHNGFLLGEVKFAKPGVWDPLYFLRRIRSAKVLLKYLPQVVFEVFETSWRAEGEKGETSIEYVVEPYNSINYAYMGREAPIEKVYIDDELESGMS